MSDQRHERHGQRGDEAAPQGGQGAGSGAVQPACEVGSPDFIHERRMFRSFQHDHGQRGDKADAPVRERAVGERAVGER